MRRLMLVAAIVLVVLALALAGAAELRWQRHLPNSANKVAGKSDLFNDRDWIPSSSEGPGMGQVVESAAAAGAQLGFVITTPSLLDAKYKPEIRLIPDKGASVTYPNGVRLAVVRWEFRTEVTDGFAEASQTPEDYYQAYVSHKAELRSMAERSGGFGGQVTLRPNGPYPGFEVIAEVNSSAGVKQAGAVVWARDGIEYGLVGPSDLPQEELRKIAASTL